MGEWEELPGDVRDLAFDAASEICAEGLNNTFFDVRDIVARAILAERERCARVAEAQAVEPDMDDADPYDMYEMGGRSTARQIAAAIRTGAAHD